jgi:hypothetical protein
MAGGRAGFLNELTGDFVLYLRGASAVSALVGTGNNARIFPEAARQGAEAPYIVYTRAAGNREKILAGLDGCENLTLHVYAYADSQPQSIALAEAISDRMLPTLEQIVGDGTKLKICNGGIAQTGVEHDKASGDRKRFWTRLVLRMVISD